MIIGRLARSKLLWIISIPLVILLVYLALGVFGVQTLFYDTEVNEDFALNTPEERGSSTIVSSGKFHAVAHEGTGDAIVYRLEDGSHVLRLENLDIFNGPALYVYAVAARDADDNETVLDAGFLNLGPLKGNRGNQTYELPPEFDPDRHRSISVWCKRFSVNFATAPLR
jgi:Electron transfer DM13